MGVLGGVYVLSFVTLFSFVVFFLLLFMGYGVG